MVGLDPLTRPERIAASGRSRPTGGIEILLPVAPLCLFKRVHANRTAIAVCLRGMTVIDGACLLRAGADLHHLFTVNHQEHNGEPLPNLHDR